MQPITVNTSAENREHTCFNCVCLMTEKREWGHNGLLQWCGNGESVISRHSSQLPISLHCPHWMPTEKQSPDTQ